MTQIGLRLAKDALFSQEMEITSPFTGKYLKKIRFSVFPHRLLFGLARSGVGFFNATLEMSKKKRHRNLPGETGEMRASKARDRIRMKIVNVLLAVMHFYQLDWSGFTKKGVASRKVSQGFRRLASGLNKTIFFV